MDSNEDTDRLDSMSGRIIELERQLAAERKIKSAEKQILLDEITKNKDLRTQLAAAQATIKEIAKTGKRFRDDGTDILSLQNTTALDTAIAAATKPLQYQLAAAQAAMKDYVTVTAKSLRTMGDVKFAESMENFLGTWDTAALDVAISEATRIYTRCPACNNDTLRINKGHLLCTWHACPDPTRIERPNAATKPLVNLLNEVLENVNFHPHYEFKDRIKAALAQLK